MSDDMEIMKEFEKWYSNWLEINFTDSPTFYAYIRPRLPDAVRREVRKALGKVWDLANTGGIGADIRISAKTFHEIADEYKLKPRYCDGMQEALDIGVVRKNYEGKYFYTKLNGTNYYIYACRFCKEGENCIGGKG